MMKKKHTTTAISVSLDIVEGTAFANHSSATSVNAEDKETDVKMKKHAIISSSLDDFSDEVIPSTVINNSKNDHLSFTKGNVHVCDSSPTSVPIVSTSTSVSTTSFNKLNTAKVLKTKEKQVETKKLTIGSTSSFIVSDQSKGNKVLSKQLLKIAAAPVVPDENKFEIVHEAEAPTKITDNFGSNDYSYVSFHKKSSASLLNAIPSRGITFSFGFLKAAKLELTSFFLLGLVIPICEASLAQGGSKLVRNVKVDSTLNEKAVEEVSHYFFCWWICYYHYIYICITQNYFFGIMSLQDDVGKGPDIDPEPALDAHDVGKEFVHYEFFTPALLTSSLKKDQGDILENSGCIGVACSSSAGIPVKSTVKTDDAKVVLADTSLKVTDIQLYGKVDRKNDSKTSSSYLDYKSKKTASPSSDSKSKEIASPSTVFKNHKKIIEKELWEDVYSTSRLEDLSLEKELHHSKDSILFQRTQSIAKKRKTLALFQKIPAFLLLYSFILASACIPSAFALPTKHDTSNEVTEEGIPVRSLDETIENAIDTLAVEADGSVSSKKLQTFQVVGEINDELTDSATDITMKDKTTKAQEKLTKGTKEPKTGTKMPKSSQCTKLKGMLKVPKIPKGATHPPGENDYAFMRVSLKGSDDCSEIQSFFEDSLCIDFNVVECNGFYDSSESSSVLLQVFDATAESLSEYIEKNEKSLNKLWMKKLDIEKGTKKSSQTAESLSDYIEKNEKELNKLWMKKLDIEKGTKAPKGGANFQLLSINDIFSTMIPSMEPSSLPSTSPSSLPSNTPSNVPSDIPSGE